MSLIPRGWHEPAGLELRLSFPRWVLTLAKISVGALLVVAIAGAVLSVAWGPRTGGGGSGLATRLPDVTQIAANGASNRFAVRYEIAAGDHAYDNEGWSVLYSDGSIVPARVVSGPPTFEPGTTSDVVLEADGRPGSTPLRVRFDPHGKLGYSVPIAAARP